MLFTSFEFLGFLAVLFILYYIIPKRFQWVLLLAGSYFFYYQAKPIYMVYLLTTTVTTYLTGICIDKINVSQESYLKQNKESLSKDEKKEYKAKRKKQKWNVLLCGLLLNLGILAVVKYTNFAISNVNGILKAAGSAKQFSFLDIALPMGLSFFTFQALGYIIDCYRGTVSPQKNLGKYALFVGFFPQLVQGPISRYGDLSKTLYEPHKFDQKTVAFGLQRILWGFFKKLIIADRIIVGVNELIHNPEQYRGTYVFVGMMFYALRLYADFTGGIDITIGIAQVLGIHVTENFHRPYFSKNIKEYWNRWHITMGSWFTDYIFYPISVCKPMLKFSKFSRKHFGDVIGKRMPVYLSSFAVWFATGVWHGASWNFIVWGIGNFVVIMISQELEPLYERFHKRFPGILKKTWYKTFQVVRTVLLMSSLRMFDCYRDVPLTFKMFGSMFTTFNLHVLWDGSLMKLGLTMLDYVILTVATLVLIMVSLKQRRGSVREQVLKLPFAARFVLWYGLFLLVLLFGAYGIGYDASQFIYNQF